MAKCLFPNCEFVCQNWNQLNSDKYDVILNASAIHYADDQKKFLDLLMSKLAPNGTLILEIGVAPGEGSEFIEVTRSIDKRFFPTKAKLKEMLADYAYKFISRSVPQVGDPTPREVYHIAHKLPYAILAMDDPHAGKSFTIKNIFKANIKIISGDVLYYQVAEGKCEAPQAIRDIILKNSKDMDCGKITYMICKNGLLGALCAWIAQLGQKRDFILDMYIPSMLRNIVMQGLEMAGYYVVNIQLQKAISRPRKEEKVPQDSCYRHFKHLQKEFMINEEDYLAANPDVAQALKQGRISSALAHYIFHGRKEGRKRSLTEEKNLSD